jgi:hypothetical protein
MSAEGACYRLAFLQNRSDLECPDHRGGLIWELGAADGEGTRGGWEGGYPS